MDNKQPTIHKNDNKISKDILFSGNIVIDNFEYNKCSEEQIVYVNMKVLNNTELHLHSVNIHNGIMRDKEFSFYGKISYFLFSTKYWIKKKREFHKYPLSKLLPATNFILKLSER